MDIVYYTLYKMSHEGADRRVGVAKRKQDGGRRSGVYDMTDMINDTHRNHHNHGGLWVAQDVKRRENIRRMPSSKKSRIPKRLKVEEEVIGGGGCRATTR